MSSQNRTQTLVRDLRTAARGADQNGQAVWSRLMKDAAEEMASLYRSSGAQWDDATRTEWREATPPCIGDNPGEQLGGGYHPEGATDLPQPVELTRDELHGLAQPSLHGTPGHPARTYVIRSEGGPELTVRGWLDPLCMASSDKPARREQAPSGLRRTQTYAVLEVRPDVYRGLWNALTVAGRTDVFQADGSILMDGIAVASLPGRE